ncbi:hypothetical protein Malapachy_0176 [Malassezia pachydermatis]|uniref:Mediator complex subunit 13 n=1 Tax=Malassezia pachydermatis TaxID=77020 RepID=A0A0M9VNK2_9BASI|nr:hypothetical protein Malapachy_0176 [Malassezia pachydermatis]KOS13402.1 hypothetical protein Malapachy_0176 [Malassezia pachydermatis]
MDNQVTCALDYVALPVTCTVKWYCFQADNDEQTDTLAYAVQHWQTYKETDPEQTVPSLAQLWKRMETMPLYAIEQPEETPRSLWLFVWAHSSWDPSRETSLESLPLHKSSSYVLSDVGQAWHQLEMPPVWRAHAFFLHALENGMADQWAAAGLCRISGGVLRWEDSLSHTGLALLHCNVDKKAYKHTFRAHTTQEAVVMTTSTQHVPWRPVETPSIPGEPLLAQPGDMHVLLLPSLYRATLLHTIPMLSDKALQPLRASLGASWQPKDDDQLAVLQISVVAPPPKMPIEADGLAVPLDTHAASNSTACTIVWPLSLCVCGQLETPAGSPDSWPLLTHTVEALLTSDAWTARTSHPPSPEVANYVPVQGIGAPPPIELVDTTPSEEDVFQGIGQLTEDDLSFFSASERADRTKDGPMPTTFEPVPAPMDPAPRSSADLVTTPLTAPHSDASEPQGLELQPPKPVHKEDASLSPTTLASHVVAPPSQICTLPTSPRMLKRTWDAEISPVSNSPVQEKRRLSQKYDMHGKFFAESTIKRAPEDEMYRRVAPSPRPYLATPTSAALSTPSHASAVEDSLQGEHEDNSEGEDDNSSTEMVHISALTRAVLLRRLHVSTAPRRPQEQGVTRQDARTERVHLDWTCRLPGHRWERPRILAGCGHALVDMASEAMSYARPLGLQPTAGTRSVLAHMVLVDLELDDEAVYTWQYALADKYSACHLGTLDVGQVWHYHANSWLDGMPSAAVFLQAPRVHHVIYLVYSDASACERLYRTWPLPGPQVTLVAVPLAHIVHMSHVTALAYAAYEDTWHRVCQIAPHTYETCVHLKEKATFQLAWPLKQAHSPLHQGTVLHVAYDRSTTATRVVLTDERAQRVVCRTWDSGDVHADMVQIWHLICACMTETTAACMPLEEAQAWLALAPKMKESAALRPVVLTCLEPDVGFDMQWTFSTPASSCAIHLPIAMTTRATHPVLTQRSACICSTIPYKEDSQTAYLLHMVQVLGEDVDMATCLDDVITHMTALQEITALRWPPPTPPWPWHIALLASA